MIQCYMGDAWEPADYARTFRTEAQGAINGEWLRAATYQKTVEGERVAVAKANTFAAYANLVYRSDDVRSTIVRLGVRLSGNPSKPGYRLYADHSTRSSGYNVDCAEYYLIKQARAAIPAIQYRETFPPRPTLYVYSDHSPCPRCQEDFDNLQKKYGDLQLVLMWEKRYMNHQEDDRWEIPDGKKIVGIMPPPDESDISGVQRPSVEEEADGWEVVGGGKR